MNKHFLKNLRDNIPEPLKYITAPLFRNRLLRNTNFEFYYNLLGNSRMSHDERMGFQLDQLKDVLNYAYRNVPYYTDLFNKINFIPNSVTALNDIHVLPLLTKKIIKENFDNLTSKKKVSGGYYVATTGGTSGEPLRVLLDYNSIFKESAFVYFFRKKLGYRFEDKLVTFRGLEFGSHLWKYNPMYNELVFSPFKLSKLTILKYLEKITQFDPQYLNGYLSSLYLFAKLLLESNAKIKLRLKGIFLISENIDKSQRKFLEDFFCVKTMTFYGHSERCVIAEEKEYGLYSVSPFYGYTELIKSTNGFEIVSTGFLNRTMPLIRYQTGDLCEKEKDLIAIQGRWTNEDYLLGLNNEKVFPSAFNFHSNIFQHVSNYQFFQEEKGKSKLMLIVNKDFKTSELEVMKREIDKKTKDVIDFEIKVVDTLILTPRGKFKRFVTNNKRD